MCFVIQQECKCCQYFVNSGDLFHCEDCWNKFHNGERDKDWLNEEEFKKKHGTLLAQSQKYRNI